MEHRLLRVVVLLLRFRMSSSSQLSKEPRGSLQLCVRLLFCVLFANLNSTPPCTNLQCNRMTTTTIENAFVVVCALQAYNTLLYNTRALHRNIKVERAGKKEWWRRCSELWSTRVCAACEGVVERKSKSKRRLMMQVNKKDESQAD